MLNGREAELVKKDDVIKQWRNDVRRATWICSFRPEIRTMLLNLGISCSIIP